MKLQNLYFVFNYISLVSWLLCRLKHLGSTHQVFNVLSQHLQHFTIRNIINPWLLTSLTWFSDLNLRFSSLTLSTLLLRSSKVFWSSSTCDISLAFSSKSSSTSCKECVRFVSLSFGGIFKQLETITELQSSSLGYLEEGARILAVSVVCRWECCGEVYLMVVHSDYWGGELHSARRNPLTSDNSSPGHSWNTPPGSPGHQVSHTQNKFRWLSGNAAFLQTIYFQWFFWFKQKLFMK